VCFYNDGAPIPPDQETLLFRRFSRLPGSENVKGTGLGLFIVREIIERHGGKVWAAPGQKGNEFVFEIPKPACRQAGLPAGQAGSEL
jgi:signal transduction histidine kinase